MISDMHIDRESDLVIKESMQLEHWQCFTAVIPRGNTLEFCKLCLDLNNLVFSTLNVHLSDIHQFIFHFFKKGGKEKKVEKRCLSKKIR